MSAPGQGGTRRVQGHPASAPGQTRRAWLLGAAALAALESWPRAGSATEGFETLDFDWTDGARQRAVPARLYLPHAAAARHPVPLVLFSHGLGSGRDRYRWLGQFFAEQGIASLHPQHVGSDRRVWAGSVFEMAGRLREAAQQHEAIARVADLRFALDALLGGEWGLHVDARRIVAAGHSYGANTTLLATGATVQRDGRTLALRDERLRAAIVISAPPFYGAGDARRILSGVTVPSLHVTATDDVIRVPGYYSGAEDRLAVFEATASARKWLAMYAGGSHSIFTDRAGSGGASLNPQVKEATRALALAFLHTVFDGDEAALAAWPQRWAAILARFEAVRG